MILALAGGNRVPVIAKSVAADEDAVRELETRSWGQTPMRSRKGYDPYEVRHRRIGCAWVALDGDRRCSLLLDDGQRWIHMDLPEQPADGRPPLGP